MPIQQITTGIIADGAVVATDIANGTVTGPKLGANSVSSNNIVSVLGSAITANTIANSAIQTGAVENYLRANALDFGMRNRIINGAMVIDQRNAGAAVTVNGGTQFGVDRFFGEDDTDGAFTLQQSTVAPVGFTNSLLATITTADTSLGSTQLAIIGHRVEGFNVADLMWGTANARPVTLSFWVRSSLTGTFGGALWNSAGDRSYPYSYTISAANTWEQKSVTIAGDTTGTWLTTNGRGVSISWSLGVGSTYQATAGTWASALELSSTSATSVIGTNGATFYITGVQLEEGSVPTAFEYRQQGTEMSLCQRYYAKSFAHSTVPANGIYSYYSGTFWEGSDNGKNEYVYLPVSMRVAPTFTLYGDSGRWQVFTGGSWVTSTQSIAGAITDRGFTVFIVGNISNSSLHPWYCKGDWVASAEL